MSVAFFAMGTVTNPVSNGHGDGIPDKIAWKVHPFTENFSRSSLLVVIILVSSAAVFTWIPSIPLALLALLFLVISMGPYFFPTSYSADSNGLEIMFLGVKSFRSWDEFRNFYPHDVGVHLSTLRKPGPLDPFRGSFIRFKPGKREEILRFLGKHIKRPEIAGEKAGSKSQNEDESVISDSNNDG